MDEARVAQIYELIDVMDVRLEKDSGAITPAYIQERLAVCHKYTSQLTDLMVEVGRARSTVERALALKVQEADIRFTEALTKDPDIARKRSSADRNAMARLKVAEQFNEVASLKEKAIQFKYLFDALRRTEKELKTLNADIRLQNRVMETEMGLAPGYRKSSGGDDDEDKSETGDEDPGDALKRGDGTPSVEAVAPEDVEEEPEEEAPLVAASNVDLNEIVAAKPAPVDSLMSGMAYEIPPQEGGEGHVVTVDELLKDLS